jgi:GT2 family glycosyltransferase
MTPASISIVIPTCNRVDKLLISLQRIIDCKPPPAELLVHVDAGDFETATVVQSEFPQVRLIQSSESVGPGGGRNRLIANATCPLVASFDDDSYPLDTDYFRALAAVFARFPEAGVVAATIHHEDETVQPRGTSAAWVADFVGCGCAYRREAFAATSGYVPLAVAYGMEEVDMSLRLHDQGWRVLKSDALRVFHATRRRHHNAPEVTRASVANLALLAFLRYPSRCWWIGVGQVCRRLAWLMIHGRRAGLIGGLVGIPAHLWSHRRFRAVVGVGTLRRYLLLRRNPVPMAP